MDIYGLKLHKSLSIEYLKGKHAKVVRVPGGWIYIFEAENSESCTFVPYHDEFYSTR